MDITPIYELRDRLRTAMIAGTNLLAEDFRLKRAVEALAPLEKASPVFAKIGELSRGLLAAGQAAKEDSLLDTITLVDAVCCTQGLVDVPGELDPIITGSGEGAILSNVPYSTLSPLQEALTNSGNGRYSFVRDCHEDHPELFRDYRVKAAMVQALGAPYAELADQVCSWLMEDGKDILPLLIRDFDPKGKKEMVRRLRIIEKNYGAKANDFYIKQLEEAEGEVRQNLIYALRHNSENIELLLSLTKQERGNTKRMAYYALASQEDKRAEEFFSSLYEKKPIYIMRFLYLSKASWAAKLVVDCIYKQLVLEPAVTGDKKKDEAEVESLKQAQITTIRALLCKSGEGVYDAIRFIADHTGQNNSALQKEAVWLLCSWLVMKPSAELISLVESLYEEREGKTSQRLGYFTPALLAKILAADSSGDNETWIDWLEENLYPKALNSEKQANALMTHFYDALKFIYYDKATRQYILQASIYDNIAESDYVTVSYTRPIKCDLTGRFADLLMRCNFTKADDALERLINSNNKEFCAKMEKYFYNKALNSSNPRYYFDALNKCGCTRCEGLLVHYLRTGKGIGSGNRISMWDVFNFINIMPGTREAKMQEASRIPELVKRERILIHNWNEKNYLDHFSNFAYDN